MKDTRNLSREIEFFLEKVPLLTGLDPSSLLKLASFGMLLQLEKGQFVFFQEDVSDKCYLVKSGLISITIESSDGREMVINEMRKNDLFGEVGLITNKPRSTCAFARINSEVISIPRQAFLDILDREPLLVRRLLEITANRLRSSSERESALVFLDAQARLARLLMSMDALEKGRDYLTISQEELAQRTGLTRQTVAMILGRWRRAGWLITGRGHIFLLNHQELSRLESSF